MAAVYTVTAASLDLAFGAAVVESVEVPVESVESGGMGGGASRGGLAAQGEVVAPVHPASTNQGLRALTWTPRPESGPGCLMRAEYARQWLSLLIRVWHGAGLVWEYSGDTTPFRMTGLTVRSHVRYKEIQAARPQHPFFDPDP